MENAGLDGACTEAGVFVTDTAETMMAGKACYRVVRGHY